ncbi:MAG: CPBP family intramembrane metalloprotease [Acidobacteriaceae bacterium]|nr:CPBP family intramembrane metalloprotease [Acidobacteriaceae bacterium]
MDELTPQPEVPPATASPELLSPIGPPAPDSPKRGMRWVFVGDNGIRAGWSMVLFALILVATALILQTAARFLFHPKPPARNAAMSPKVGIIGEGLQVFCVFVATAVMALIEKRPVLSYGYQGAARAARFFFGLVWGFAAISALVLALWKAGLLAFEGQLLHGGEIWRYAALWGLVFLFVALFEESLLRGYLQFTLTRGIGFWWSALLLSFVFGFGHGSNPGESPVGLFSAGAIGLVFCISLWYTGSLWWAVGFHAAWDWGESYFYGTADSGMVAQGHLFGEHPIGKLLLSGGATGPEGSLLVVPLVVIVALLMWLWWGRRVVSPFAGSGGKPAWTRKAAVLEIQPRDPMNAPG